jgi:hypothetical protein
VSYLPTSGLTAEQEEALFVEPARIAELPVPTRVSLAMEHERLELARKDAFWTAVQGAATVLLPMAISIGLVGFITGKK